MPQEDRSRSLAAVDCSPEAEALAVEDGHGDVQVVSVEDYLLLVCGLVVVSVYQGSPRTSQISA